MYIKYDKLGNILRCQNEILEGENTVLITDKEVILDSKVEFSKQNYYYDIVNNKIKIKPSNMLLEESKKKILQKLREILNQNPDYITEFQTNITAWKISIKNATTKNQLNTITDNIKDTLKDI